jgi:hypothetical protein
MAIRLNLCQRFAKCESGEGGTFQDFVGDGLRQGVRAMRGGIRQARIPAPHRLAHLEIVSV